MSDTDMPAVGAGPDAVFELPADAPEAFASYEDAGRFFSELGEPKKKPPAESADHATADNELSVEDNAAPPKEAHGEDEEIDPEAEKLPLIERPKSWTEAEDAEWQATPRALQQKIVARELDRDTALRRAQNDAAEKLKGLTAKEQAAEQVRQQYEGKLAEQMESLLAYNDQRFSLIKSQADLNTLAQEATRLSNAGEIAQAQQVMAYLEEWRVHQTSMAGKKAELEQANARKATERQNEAIQRRTREHGLLIEKAPEYADAKKLAQAQTDAANLFRAKGYSDKELEGIGDNPLIDDHRFQLIVADALKYQAIQNAPKPVASKPVPLVQRPGTAKPAGSANAERIQALTRQLNETGDMEIAQQLYALQSRAS